VQTSEVQRRWSGNPLLQLLTASAVLDLVARRPEERDTSANGLGKLGYVGSPVPRAAQVTVPPILHIAQTSVCSEGTSASSTSMPRYRTVLSILLPAGNRLDYLPRRTMSRRGQLS